MRERLEGASSEMEKSFKATTYIDLTRHGRRYGGPMEIKFRNGETMKFSDPTDLTPEGKAGAREFGRTGYPKEVTLVHPRGGDEIRHGESGEDFLSESGKFGQARIDKELGPAPILMTGQRVKGSRRGEGTDYATAGMMPELKGVKQLINDKLNELVSALSDTEQEQFKTNAEFRASLREQAQNTGLAAAMRKDELVRIAAENEAYELMHAIKLSRRGVQGGETKAIPIVGSGMFAESLYKYALVVEDPQTRERKVGFDDVSEIGGFTKQSTAVRLKLERDTRLGDPRRLEDFTKDTKVSLEFTDPERVKLFEGKQVSLDWDKVRELAEAAGQRFE